MPDIDRLRFLWHRVRQQLWWRPAVWSVAAVLVALGSALADAWVPADWLPPLKEGLVSDLLRIMATSMLAVSTFSLSVLASAYASAASAATPRATRLVVADPQSQKSVAVFLAAFIFSIVGVVAMGTGRYGPAGRMVLFVCALGVLAWVVVAFMRYIDVLSRIGRVSHTIATVERATQSALQQAVRRPLGGALMAASASAGARPVTASNTGHVQFVDIEALQQLAHRLDGQVHVAAQVGDLVHPRAPLAWLRLPQAAAADQDSLAELRRAFVIGPERSIEQDPAYGLIVLAEIAERALSPAVNDPGTAIAVIGSQVRLMIAGLAETPDPAAPRFDRVSTPAGQPEALVALALEPIARCATGQPEVMMQVLRHLDALCRNAPPSVGVAARDLVPRLLARAERGGADPEDLERWHDEARNLGLRGGGAR
ncbi:DUF2254 domain-containing protein [Hydrogenophaga sp. ZJX-1]|uniref:DUF2254 domain-containing protein n=1 Tax=Hydrogenophaga sp. ZJX-1 TaxID=3404778 RepID=UPI003B284B39